MNAPAWLSLSWTTPEKGRREWLKKRVRELGRAVCAFEVALEGASETGEIDLGPLDDEVAGWEDLAAIVWMYAVRPADEFPEEEDVPDHAEELQLTASELAAARAALLDRLGAKASRVLAREARADVTDAAVAERARQASGGDPDVTEETFIEDLPDDELAEEDDEAESALLNAPANPVTASEMQARDAAESKPAPAPHTLAAVLALQPTDWIEVYFEANDLELDDDDEAGDVKATRMRKSLEQTLLDARYLRDRVMSLEEDEWAIVEDLVKGNGVRPYFDLANKHGRDDADGYRWSERPPSGPLAALRRAGLVYVLSRNGKKFALIPSDLLGPITAILAEAAKEAAES